MLQTLSVPSGLCCHVSASFPPLRPLSKPATAETPEQTMPRLPASPLLVSFQFSPCFIHPGTSILAEPVHHVVFKDVDWTTMISPVKDMYLHQLIEPILHESSKFFKIICYPSQISYVPFYSELELFPPQFELKEALPYWFCIRRTTSDWASANQSKPTLISNCGAKSMLH